jgi:hypothetical protein
MRPVSEEKVAFFWNAISKVDIIWSVGRFQNA